MEFSIPEELQRRILEAFGADGEGWPHALPERLRPKSAQWEFTPRRLLAARQSIVLEGVLEGTVGGLQRPRRQVVLKLALPGDQLRCEAAALTNYDGAGCVRMLGEEQGALILEKLSPGTSLAEWFKDGRDRGATEIAARVMRQLHGKGALAEPGTFRTVADWGRGWRRLEAIADGEKGPFESRLFNTSQAVYSEMLASSSAPLLLHGDLHHENILNTGNGGWVAIDPKGILGEREYEAGAWMRNPVPQLAACRNLAQILAERLDLIAECGGFDRKRLWGWSFSQAVLAAIWAFEDHGAGWQPFIAVAEALESLE